MDGELLVPVMRGRPWTAALIAAALLAAIGLFALWRGDSPPGWVRWEQGEVSGGGGGPERIRLAGRRHRVTAGEEVLWQPEEGVLVQSFLWCDINHDGAEELLLLCWKRGRYGDSRPFWVVEEDTSWSQHIFIYQWTGETMRPLWMASDLGREVEAWRFDEENRLTLTDRAGRVTAWDWVTWGLSAIPGGGA